MLAALMVMVLSQIKVQQDGVQLGAGWVQTLNCGTNATCTRDAAKRSVTIECAGGGGAGGAPTNATYITQTSNGSLSSEQSLSSLSTGLVKVTTGTGVLTSAASGTDFAPATSGSTVLLGNAAGGFSNYAGTSCTNQFPRSFSTAGAATCASVSLTADVSGTLTQGSGGTGAGALTCSAGQALTSNGTVYACTSTLTASDVACAGACVADAEIAGVAGSKVSGAVATATALAADPADCAANTYATAIAASGALTCGAVSLSAGVSGNLPVTNLNSGTSASASTYWSGAGTWTTPAGTYALPDSTSGTTGGLRLTGDLGGTATNPSVVDDSHAHTGATISALNTSTLTAGTLPAARGGLGQAQPTCSVGQYLTCNGTTCSCVFEPKVVTANVTNSTTTPANITGLSWAVAANTAYGFTCAITSSGTATALARFNLNGPAAATTVSFATERYITTSTQTLLVLQAFSAAAQTAACTASCNTTVLPTLIHGTILNGANAGTAQLMVTSSTAGQTVTLYRGSSCAVY